MSDPAASPAGPGTVTEFAWLRHGQPVPEGWTVPPQRLDSHHNHYAVLIARPVPPTPAGATP